MSAHSVYIMRFLYSERVYNIRLLYFLIDCRHIWVHFPFPINIQAGSVVWERQASYMSVEEELLFEGRDVEWPHSFLWVF